MRARPSTCSPPSSTAHGEPPEALDSARTAYRRCSRRCRSPPSRRWSSSTPSRWPSQCAVAAGRPARRAPPRRGPLRPAVLPRGGPPGDLAPDRGRAAERRLGRGARALRAVPRGLGAGRSAGRRQPAPRAVRRGHRPRAARRRRRRASPGWRWSRPLRDPRPAPRDDPLRRVLRRAGAAPPRPGRGRRGAARRRARGVRQPLQRHVAAPGTPRPGPRPPSWPGSRTPATVSSAPGR